MAWYRFCSIYLLVLANRVAKRNETRLELIRSQTSCTRLVEMIEGSPELVELLLGDALGVASEDLVLHLVDGSVDRSHQLFPTNTQRLHRVLGVLVLEHKRLLDLLIDPLQLLQMGFELIDSLLVFPQP